MSAELSDDAEVTMVDVSPDQHASVGPTGADVHERQIAANDTRDAFRHFVSTWFLKSQLKVQVISAEVITVAEVIVQAIRHLTPDVEPVIFTHLATGCPRNAETGMILTWIRYIIMHVKSMIDELSPACSLAFDDDPISAQYQTLCHETMGVLARLATLCTRAGEMRRASKEMPDSIENYMKTQFELNFDVMVFGAIDDKHEAMSDDCLLCAAPLQAGTCLVASCCNVGAHAGCYRAFAQAKSRSGVLTEASCWHCRHKVPVYKDIPIAGQ